VSELTRLRALVTGGGAGIGQAIAAGPSAPAAFVWLSSPAARYV
jgi:NADP-dependent 3-hydroxy acid dehydrogenase YdfG